MENYSVLISVYHKDHPEHFRHALESLCNQIHKPSQVVLVKDGAIGDDLISVVNEFVNKSSLIVDIVDLPKNVGLGNALNAGLHIVKNQLVGRMDADDICISDRFLKQVDFMNRNPEISVVGAYVEEFNVYPNDIGNVRKLPEKSEDIKKFAKYRNPLSHPSVMFRKQDVLSVGSYDHMPFFEDYYLWVRMMLKGYNMANIPSVLLNFRIGNNMIGRRHGVGYLKYELKFYLQLKKLGFLRMSEVLKVLILRMPLRLIPKWLLRKFYSLFLRSKKV